MRAEEELDMGSRSHAVQVQGKGGDIFERKWASLTSFSKERGGKETEREWEAENEREKCEVVWV